MRAQEGDNRKIVVTLFLGFAFLVVFIAVFLDAVFQLSKISFFSRVILWL